jgi:hypothetical protein
MQGRGGTSYCPGPRAYLAPLEAFPAPAGRAAQRAASPKQTLEIAARTLREAEATWLLANAVSSGPVRVAGLEGGVLETSDDSFRLTEYSLERGVTLTGEIRMSDAGPPLRFRGAVRVGGARASPGELALRREGLAGVLGGRSVRESWAGGRRR